MSHRIESDLLLGNWYVITHAFKTQAHYFHITGYNDCDELRDLLLKQTNSYNWSMYENG